MQLNLLDLSGNETTNKVVIEWLDISLVSPSDDNPRLSLNQEVIDGLVSVLQESGWATISPIAVRKIANGYEVVDGHHRLESAKQAKATQVLCTVLEMTDEEAVIQRWLLNNQTEFKDIEKCLYFYKHTKKGSKLGLSRAEFAKKLKSHRSTGMRWADAGEVAEECCLEATLLEGKTRALAEIHSVPRHYWQQLTELLITNEWSVKQTEEICKAVRDIDIPEYLHEVLPPDKYIKELIKEVSRKLDITIPRKVANWVKEIGQNYNSLSDALEITVVNKKKKSTKVIEWDLKQEFLNRLKRYLSNKKDAVLSGKKINAIALELRKVCTKINEDYEEWLEVQKNSKQLAEIEAEREKARLEKIAKYSCVGYNDKFENVLPNIDIKFDAIITDPPYLLSNNGTTVRSGREVSVNKNFADNLEECAHPKDYLPLFLDCLKDGGYFVYTSTHHLNNLIIPIAEEIGFEYVQNLYWYKPNATPQMIPDRFAEKVETITVFKKKGKSYFGYNDIKEKDDKQRHTLIEIPVCGGNERLQWHDTQKPIALMELLIKAYVPFDGLVLDPFAGTGTTAVACKQNYRICHWIEEKPEFYEKTELRIDQVDFPFVTNNRKK